jgi:putative redox protein
MRWRDNLVFEGGAPGKPAIVVDGDSAAATSPVELLLLAAATCSASDVVIILRKQRATLRALEIALHGTRRAEEPRRYTALHFLFTIAGDGVDEAKARRAVDLSLEKYCSVVASLAPDIRISYDVALR